MSTVVFRRHVTSPPASTARSAVLRVRAVVFATAFAFACLAAPIAGAEQVWLGQSVSLPATENVRLTFSNTTYTEHGDHFANEEAASFRWRFAPNWSAGAGITFGQDRVDRVAEADGDADGGGKRWVWSSRPTEHVSLDWSGTYGGWTFFNAQHLDLYFRKDERDWPLYRNIGSLTAPPVPGLPWRPRPYLTEQIYFSGRECFTGFDRFNQVRLGAGVRLHPCENLMLSAYWQYRDIEQLDGAWEQFRVAGISAALVF